MPAKYKFLHLSLLAFLCLSSARFCAAGIREEVAAENAKALKGYNSKGLRIYFGERGPRIWKLSIVDVDPTIKGYFPGYLEPSANALKVLGMALGDKAMALKSASGQIRVRLMNEDGQMDGDLTRMDPSSDGKKVAAGGSSKDTGVDRADIMYASGDVIRLSACTNYLIGFCADVQKDGKSPLFDHVFQLACPEVGAFLFHAYQVFNNTLTWKLECLGQCEYDPTSKKYVAQAKTLQLSQPDRGATIDMSDLRGIYLAVDRPLLKK